MKGAAFATMFLMVFAINVASAVDTKKTVLRPSRKTPRAGIPQVKAAVVTGAGGRAAFDAFDKFMARLGEDNGDDPGPIDGGFRRINWDGAGVPFNMPPNFFRDEVRRGSLVETKGNEFVVSNPVMKNDPGFGDNLFDTFNPQYPEEFSAFSGARIFSSLSDNTFDQTFSVPGSVGNKADPATISAFGGVFVDVDTKGDTWMEFFDKFGTSLGRFDVAAAPQGFTFLGVDFGKPVIASMTVNLGNVKLGADDIPRKQDVVVMDDFIYSEPVPV